MDRFVVRLKLTNGARVPGAPKLQSATRKGAERLARTALEGFAPDTVRASIVHIPNAER